jgi:LPXTG-motif cell wall-anchored protein
MFILTPVLPEGKYTVTWRAVTEDDNGITNGTFSFTVSSGGGTTTGTSTTPGGTTTGTGGSSLPSTGSGDAAPLTLLGLVLATLLLGAGTLAKRAARAQS